LSHLPFISSSSIAIACLYNIENDSQYQFGRQSSI
jgi:hypothetical protein